MSGADDDLDALLESALEDFTREAKTPNIPPPSPSPAPPSPQIPNNNNNNNNLAPKLSSPPNNPPKPSSNSQNIPDVFASLFQGLGSETGDINSSLEGISKLLDNPELREEFEQEMQQMMESFSKGNLSEEISKLANLNLDELNSELNDNNNNNNNSSSSSNNNNNEGGSNAAENSPFGKALDSLLQQAKQVEEKQGTNVDETDLLGMMNNPELMDAVQQLADRFLSKDVLADVMVDLQKQFKEWLDKNGESASPEDFQRFTQQLQCIEQIVELYNKTDEPEEKDVADLLMRLQSLGKLPDEMVSKTSCPIM